MNEGYRWWAVVNRVRNEGYKWWAVVNRVMTFQVS
jgi:hypothetical protein